MTRPACAVIDRAALKANLARVHSLAPGKRVMAIIKADAYGHGLTRVAASLPEADAFGVACLEEASALREAGVSRDIVLLEGPFSAAELPEIRRLSLDTVVHHEVQVEWLEHAGDGAHIGVWLKIDTGMHRLGFDPADVAGVWKRLRACRVVSEIRLMTHLASAHERAHASVGMQLQCFEQTVRELPGERCIANSAGVIAWPDTHADWVRPGLMLYGVSPFGDTVAAEEGLRPVMSLRSELIAVKRVCAGEAVGYGGTWRCPEDMPVGVVAMGYGDGYPRHAAAGTPVLVGGTRVALIGKASMDMLAVDLRNKPEARVGDPVVLWGEGLAVEEVARHAGTIPYELLCSVRSRVRFVDRGQD